MDITPVTIEAMRAWSKTTFGPTARTEGIIDHITKELQEIRESPFDLEEWIDVAILAFDGAWRAGYSPEEILTLFHHKLGKNMRRQWPDWRESDGTTAIEHDRSACICGTPGIGDYSGPQEDCPVHGRESQ
jgi:hypothetical protein